MVENSASQQLGMHSENIFIPATALCTCVMHTRTHMCCLQAAAGIQNFPLPTALICASHRSSQQRRPGEGEHPMCLEPGIEVENFSLLFTSILHVLDMGSARSDGEFCIPEALADLAYNFIQATVHCTCVTVPLGHTSTCAVCRLPL